MTFDTLSPDRERDVKIAEALGAAAEMQRVCVVEDHHRQEGWCYWCKRLVSDAPMRGPRYSTDPVAFETLLQEIGRRGLGVRYMIALSHSLDFPGFSCLGWNDLFKYQSAPLDVKAEAALRVLTEATT